MLAGADDADALRPVYALAQRMDTAERNAFRHGRECGHWLRRFAENAVAESGRLPADILAIADRLLPDCPVGANPFQAFFAKLNEGNVATALWVRDPLIYGETDARLVLEAAEARLAILPATDLDRVVAEDAIVDWRTRTALAFGGDPG